MKNWKKYLSILLCILLISIQVSASDLTRIVDTTTSINNIITEIEDQYATKDDLTTNRMLSPTGDFTGTWNGLTIDQLDTGSSAALDVHETKSATQLELGHVKVDGSTITINEQGVISSIGGGAVGDINPVHIRERLVTETDDTNAVLDAITQALAEQRPVVVSPKEYIVNSGTLGEIIIPTDKSLVIMGYGPQSVIKRKAGSVTDDWKQLFRFVSDGIGHANALVIKDLYINDNAIENPIPEGQSAFLYEHSSCINPSGSSATSKIKNVIIQNVTLNDPVADGIYISDPYIENLIIDNLHVPTRNRVRSDIEFSYGVKNATITNCNLQNLEMEWVGDFTDGVMQLNISNVNVTQSIDFMARHNQCNINAVALNGYVTTFKNMKGVVSNSNLKVKSDTDMRWNEGLSFIDCEFLHDVTESGGIYTATDILISTASGLNDPEDIVFDNCRFKLNSTQPTIVGTCIVGTSILATSTSIMKRTVKNCWFDPRWEYNIDTNRGGTWLLKDNDYAGKASIKMFGSATYPTDITIEGGDFSRCTDFVFVTSAPLTLRIKNVVIDEANADFDNGDSNYASVSTIMNNRIIYGTSSPTGAAFPGDTWRLKTPVAGQAYEWAAPNIHPTAATWKLIKTLP